MRAAVAICVLTAACADPTDVEVAYRCNTSLCGSNSPTLADLPFFDFSLDHAKNAEGFVYLGMTQGKAVYDLEVVNSQMIAHDWRGTTLVGNDLVGAVLYFDYNGDQYGITIDHLGAATETVPGGSVLESYYFVWSKVRANRLRASIDSSPEAVPEQLPELGSEITALCPDFLAEDAWSYRGEWDETASTMEAFEAIVFEGDRIDQPTRTVSPGYDDRWVNIGCAAHTLAKLRLSRSTIHTAASWEQEQATLKMLSADYCGSGMAFTVSGEPLVWRNLVGFDYFKPPRSLEARWSKDGALCLGEPRLVVTDNPEALAEFPDVIAQIKDECQRAGRPVTWCSDPDPDVVSLKPDEIITSANRDP